MPDMALRMAARIGHPSAIERLRKELEENPPPPSEPIRCNARAKCAIIDVSPLGRDQYGHVYVIGFADYVKIGWSGNGNIAKRLFEIQKNLPEELVLYKLIAAYGPEAERELHKKFSHLRLRGDWFALSNTLRDWIEDGCSMQ